MGGRCPSFVSDPSGRRPSPGARERVFGGRRPPPAREAAQPPPETANFRYAEQRAAYRSVGRTILPCFGERLSGRVVVVGIRSVYLEE